LEELNKSVVDSKKLLDLSKKQAVCPYEIGIMLTKKARVIITDYNYIFNPNISTPFLKKIGKSYENSILIVDEGHNLPDRLKDCMSESLTTNILENAYKESESILGDRQLMGFIKGMTSILKDYAKKTPLRFGFVERLIERNDFLEEIKQMADLDQIIAELYDVSEEILEKQKFSSLKSVAKFLDAWRGDDEGFARILSVEDKKIVLSYKCLDPSLVSSEVINKSYATILMSGTLTPTGMYKELLGVDNVVEKEFSSPFPKENRLNLVVPGVSTVYKDRSVQQYKNIAKVIDNAAAEVPGNILVLFPSYALKRDISQYLVNKKTVFSEEPKMTKKDKEDVLAEFVKHRENGSILLGVMGGSFGEGMDLPNDVLKGVFVVGLPLGMPNLETKSLIEYYDKKFGKGQKYGYYYPAIIKVMQGIGRLNRSETDSGVGLLIDSRFGFPDYKSCFPADWDLNVSSVYSSAIRQFFS
jgi:DNA excision repair protein ERCC-2